MKHTTKHPSKHMTKHTMRPTAGCGGVLLRLAIALALIGVCLAFCAAAGAATSGSYEYSESSDGTVYITGYTGTATSLTLPTTLGGKKVTWVGGFSFNGNTTIKTLTIPACYTSIGQCAFANCTALTTVNLREGLTTIADAAFANCPSLTSVTLPASVYNILGEQPFADCTSLTSIGVNASNTSFKSVNGVLYSYDGTILYCMPAGKSGSFTIPSGVTAIASGAFSGASRLTAVSFPESIRSFGSRAFYGCTGLTELTIPEGVTYLQSYVFNHCTGLSRVTLPESLIGIRDYAFGYCSALAHLTIPAGATSISEYAFSNSGLTEITLPAGVTEIRANTFESCRSLAEVTLPEGVTSIGQNAFYNSGLTGITLPASVTAIGKSAFSKCTGLTEITVPEGVTALGESVFSGCTGLTDVTLPESLDTIGNSAFSGCTGLTGIAIPEGVTAIGSSAFYNCNRLTAVTLPEGLTGIGNNAFYSCTSLTGITIPEGVTTIGQYAFYDCNGLTAVTLPEGLTGIGNYTFCSCDNLTSITIPEGVTTIGSQAFGSCTSLTAVTLPESLASVGNYAFYNAGLTDVYYGGTPESWSAVTIGTYNASLTNAAFHYHEHTWGDPVYTWAEDYAAVTAQRVCQGNPRHTETETVAAALSETTPSTCSEPGESVYVSDPFANPAFTAQTLSVSLPLADHDPVTIPGYAPTCTEDGWSDEIFCAECGELIQEGAAVPALGHDWAHTACSWAEDGSACAMTFTCARCGAEETEDAGVTAEAEGNETCSEMGWTVYTASLTRGETVYDDTLRLQDVPTLPHTPEVIPAAAPDCTGAGLSEGERCAVCGEVLVPQETVPALGHAWALTAADWAEDGSACAMAFACERCGAQGAEDAMIVANPETNESCTEWAWTEYTASASPDGQVLSDVLRLQDVPPIDHDVVIVPGVPPTDREPGCTESSHCGRCGLVFTEPETLPALWSYTDDGLTVTGYNGTETELTIPAGVTALSDTLFKGNTAVTTVRVPEGVVSIGAQTFFQATGLREIWLPDSLSGIGNRTFYNVSAVFHAATGSPTAVALSRCRIAFTNEDGWTLFYNIPTGAVEPGSVKIVRVPVDTGADLAIPADFGGVPAAELAEGAAANLPAMADVHIPDSIAILAADAFDGCAEGLTIHSSMDAAAHAFALDNGFNWAHEPHAAEILPGRRPTSSRPGLTEGSRCTECGEILVPQEEIPAYGPMETADFTLPADTETIGDEAFRGIAARVADIPDGVTAIGSAAFADCAALRQIRIPASVEIFGSGVFDGCGSGLLVYGYAESPAEAWAEASGLTFVVID